MNGRMIADNVASYRLHRRISRPLLQRKTSTRTSWMLVMLVHVAWLSPLFSLMQFSMVASLVVPSSTTRSYSRQYTMKSRSDSSAYLSSFSPAKIEPSRGRKRLEITGKRRSFSTTLLSEQSCSSDNVLGLGLPINGETDDCDEFSEILEVDAKAIPPGRLNESKLSTPTAADLDDADSRTTLTREAHIPPHLVSTLDLSPLMAHVATYACTKRGKEAILSLVQRPRSSSNSQQSNNGRQSFLFGNRSSPQTKSRRNEWFSNSNSKNNNDRFYQRYSTFRVHNNGISDDVVRVVAPISQSASEASMEYELVSQAMDILQSQSGSVSSMGSGKGNNSNVGKVSLPPMFQLRDRVSDGIATTTTTNEVAAASASNMDSDDDEWIDICLASLPPGIDIFEEVDLESILQAEQVVKLLLDTYKWAMRDDVQMNTPGLAEIARCMDDEDAEKAAINNNTDGSEEPKLSGVAKLTELYNNLQGAIEIVRAGPSMSDPYNRFSYQFQLSSSRFTDLEILRQKEDEILDRGKGKETDISKDNKIQQQLFLIRAEISALEHHIKRKLVTAMMRAAPTVQGGMNAVAKLDVIFSKAAFGCEWNGKLPVVGEEGRVGVDGFIHPVLALEKRMHGEEEAAFGGGQVVVPVDLKMPRSGGYQALMISGPNAGGKTLALKSFGLVATMVKLGIPIPTTTKNGISVQNPVVDYFHDITVEVGDNQSVMAGESTLMARLNACSSLIERVTSLELMGKSKLVLLDELGGGTDPVAGASIAQAILEKLISADPKCKIVATTHSPQLKVLSINDDRFQSASVLLSSKDVEMSGETEDGEKKYLQPTYRLSYGTTGESYALGAASRCRPSLPDDVINRAAELMSGGEEQAGEALRSHLSALESERTTAISLTEQSYKVWKEVQSYKSDMVVKMEASVTNLARLESRLEGIFAILKEDDTRNAYDLVGDSLGELRALKKKVKSEKELLAERGLRRVSESHSFYEGETVVITAEGEWEGCNAIVKVDDSENADPHSVMVIPTVDWFSSPDDNSTATRLVLKRTDIAVWDYPDEWGFSDQYSVDASSYSEKSERSQSKQNVLNILSTLKTNDKPNKSSTAMKQTSSSPSFTSARQRKAAAALEKSGKKNKGKKKK